MKSKLQVLLIGLCMSCTPGGVVSAQGAPLFEGPQAEIDAILTLLTQWGERREAADIDGVIELHHPDVWIMTRDRAIIKGHDGARAFYLENYDAGSSREQYGTLTELRVSGGMATMIGRFLVVDEAKGIEDPGNYLIVLRKDNGAWRIFRDIDTPSPDGLALMPDE